jgi:hypothetical protein
MIRIRLFSFICAVCTWATIHEACLISRERENSEVNDCSSLASTASVDPTTTASLLERTNSEVAPPERRASDRAPSCRLWRLDRAEISVTSSRRDRGVSWQVSLWSSSAHQ